ncbi:hypothetical protein ANN_09446 [Periplaneta americana]|uniref:Uncharacterized protein n=1 Tax=Periplaneta americana TaxID=6978 RepID=A0ABQ8TPB0_PERAM|nr:hypothetical protein ANN_09446 [Periplaneta americana]
MQDFNWEVLDQPPYSPDLAPSNYHLFMHIKTWLGSKHFDDDEELKTSVVGWLQSQAAEFYDRGTSKLVKRYDKCLNTAELNKILIKLFHDSDNLNKSVRPYALVLASSKWEAHLQHVNTCRILVISADPYVADTRDLFTESTECVVKSLQLTSDVIEDPRTLSEDEHGSKQKHITSVFHLRLQKQQQQQRNVYFCFKDSYLTFTTVNHTHLPHLCPEDGASRFLWISPLSRRRITSPSLPRSPSLLSSLRHSTCPRKQMRAQLHLPRRATADLALLLPVARSQREFVLGDPLPCRLVSHTQDISHNPTRRNPVRSDHVNELATKQDLLFLSTFQGTWHTGGHEQYVQSGMGSILLEPHTLTNIQWDMF